MKKNLILLVATLALLTACDNKRPTSLNEVTEWPLAIFAGDYPDPSILADGEDYYMTFTTNYWLPALPIWHSTDLVNWQPIGNALNTYLGTVWAPDFQKVDGRYYIYFPADGRIYVVWADDVHGPWSEPVDLGIRAIDPGLVVGNDGSRALYVNGGRMVRLAPDGLSTIGELQHAYDVWPIPEDWVVECDCLESPKLLKHDGWYYIISAQGGTAGPATSHMAVACRSRNIEGPWEQSPYNPIVHTWSADETWWSKGHGTLFADAQGQWWMVYHAYRKNYHTLGRHTLLEPMTWTPDGWPIADTQARRMLPAKATSAKGEELQWLSWKGDTDMQAAVVGDTCYTFTGRVTLPAHDGEAGLLLRYNEKVFSGITADATTLHVWHEGKAAGEYPNPYGQKLWLRIVNHRNAVTLYAGRSPRRMEAVASVDVSQMHHNRLGSFMSLRPAWRRTTPACTVDKLTVVADE
jgi:Beta-xylosidase